jgi:hypothetical protein
MVATAASTAPAMETATAASVTATTTAVLGEYWIWR